jgi:hypothetical protein
VNVASGKENSILGSSGLNGKSITGLKVTQHGVVVAIEISYSGGSQLVKVKQTQVEVGGTLDWGTGTIQNF